MENLYNSKDTIFVQIASYRDCELQHTLQDLFKKAKKPENIFVGICHQYDNVDGSDKHLFEVPFPRPNQLRIDEVYYKDSKGCCFARNRVQKLWKGEKWTLMIDSHMRFEEGWDEICVSTIKNLASENCKPVLSTYVCSYNLEGNFDKYISNPKTNFDAQNTAVINGGFRINPKQPLLNAFFCAHFCFAPAEIIREIEYDPALYFIGEEISISARLWTLGYDIFVPDKVTVYHLYRVAEKVNRVISTADDLLWTSRDGISRARVAQIFKTVISTNPEVLNKIEHFGLGKKRSLRDFERFSGVDFRRKKQRERTKQSSFGKWLETSKIADVKNIFQADDL